MEQTDGTQPEELAADETQADGYYGEDDAESEELDLSFLDEDDSDDVAAKSDAPKQS